MTDYVEIFVARGDKGTTFDSLYDGYLVDYRDPDLHGTAKRKLSEHMLKCYQCLLVKRSDFEQKIKAKFGANADKENVKSKADQDAFRSAKGKVDFAALITEAAKARIDCPELTKIRSADASPVIDCRNLDVSKIVVDTLTNGGATGVKDLMLVGSGEYTVGVEGDYETIALCLADFDNIAVNQSLGFKPIAALTETLGAAYNKKIEGRLYCVNPNRYLISNSYDGNQLTITPSTGSTGNIEFDSYRHKPTCDTGSTRYLVRITAEAGAFTGTCTCKKMRLDSDGKRFIALDVGFNSGKFYMYRSIFKNQIYPTYGRTALNISVIPSEIKLENVVFDTCGVAIYNSSAPTVMNSCVFINCPVNISSPANSQSINCATNAAAIGAATNTDPVVNIDIANEFVNTDIDDLTNGYKCKRSGTIYALGAAPTLAENTADIFGRPANAPYEIGVGREAYVPNITSITVTNHTTITITGTGFKPGTVNPVVTENGETVTPDSISDTEIVYTTEIEGGTLTYIVTNSDGQSDSVEVTLTTITTDPISTTGGCAIAIGTGLI
jgi:hypothetical protein